MSRCLPLLWLWVGACVPTGEPSAADGGAASAVDPCARCAGSEPLCDRVGMRCVQCLDNEDCGDPLASRCDLARHACVPCRANNVTDCDAVVVDGQPLEICDEGTCIACRQGRDCGALAPVCQAGECVGCSSAGECARFPERPHCVAGACSACLPDDPTSCGPGTLCDLLAGACVPGEAGALPSCAPCVNPLQCADGDRCVQAPDATEAPGFVCLRDARDGCEATRLSEQIGARSIDGTDAVVCAPTYLDCASLAAHGAPCDGDGECGPNGTCVADAAGGMGRCAVGCERQADCRGADLPADLTCRGYGSVLLCLPAP